MIIDFVAHGDLQAVMCVDRILYAYVHDQRNSQILTWYMI